MLSGTELGIVKKTITHDALVPDKLKLLLIGLILIWYVLYIKLNATCSKGAPCIKSLCHFAWYSLLSCNYEVAYASVLLLLTFLGLHTHHTIASTLLHYMIMILQKVKYSPLSTTTTTTLLIIFYVYVCRNLFSRWQN